MTKSTITYKCRIYPNKLQVEKLNSWLSLSCELYNAALQERIEAYKLNRISISYVDQNKQLTEIKKIRTEFAEINSHVLQDALQRLNKAFQNFFRRVKNKNDKAGFPRFKSWKKFNSFSVPNTRYKIKGNIFNLSILGEMKMRGVREIEGTLKTATIKKQCDKWFVCIGVEFDPIPLKQSEKQIGIDVGLKSFAVLSNGETIQNPRHAEKSQRKLRVAQRRVSRRKKGSNRRQKAVMQLKKLHQKIYNQRQDAAHKLSYALVSEYGVIAIEKLNMKGLSKGFLSKQINDAAWSAFFNKLEYKAENAGRKLIKVNPNGTSQTCLCGANVPKTLAVRIHKCESCGIVCDRDLMSARIILERAKTSPLNANVNQ